MSWRTQFGLPLLVGFVCMILGGAALYSGDRLRGENLGNRATAEAWGIVRNIQARLLQADTDLGELSALSDSAAFAAHNLVVGADDDHVIWRMSEAGLESFPGKFMDDRSLVQQLRGVGASGTFAPLTSGTGRDLVLVTSATGSGWVGATIPADILIPKAEANALALDSLEIAWVGEPGETELVSIFRAGFQVGPERIEFPVPGGSWNLHYETRAEEQRGELNWTLILLVIVLSYGITLVYYRVATKPRALRRDLARLNERFTSLNENLRSVLIDREQEQNRSYELSVTDQETSLPNRRAFTECIEQNLNTMRTNPVDQCMSVVVVGLRDVENAAHAVGQFVLGEVMPEIVQRLQKHFPGNMYVARTSTYNLAVLLPDCDEANCLYLMDELMTSNVAGIYEHRFGTLNVVPRFGIVTVSDGYGYADKILDDAMSALSDAEIDERRWSLFETDSRDDRVTMIQLESEFKTAIENGDFRLLFQPIVHTRSGVTKGFECLVRWQHPVDGLLSPERFIGLAETTGLITELTRWVIAEAIRHAAAWDELRKLGCYLSINLSTLDLQQSSLATDIVSQVADAGLKPSTLRLEITETMFINNVMRTRKMLNELRTAGFATMLDDFGTGFSSLSYLQQMPFSTVKIDQSFTRAITTDSKYYGMMQNILNLVHFLEMETIVEGVETKAQQELLLPLDPGYCQGYLYSKPMSAIEAQEYLMAATSADGAVGTVI